VLHVYVLGIASAGPVAPVRDRLADAFADHGRVAMLEGDAVEPTAPGAATAYRIDDGGRWEASGTGLGVDGALDRFAPSHEYAILTGFPEADVPHLVVGDPGYGGDVLATADGPESVDPAAVREAVEDTEPHETLESLIRRAKDAEGSDRAGAVATFTGRVRERDDPEDAPTTHLEFEAYEGVAEDRMETLETELTSREGVFAVRMHHRTGVVRSGEDIVFVVVLAGHREEAFETVSDGIDRLKSEVPIFKKEVTVEEEFWRHDP
jgi:molybdopterin synthase catalytic subunit